MGEKRGLPRKAGHSQGAKVFRRTVEDCRDIGIKYCTFYAFSTENWKRPKDEVDAIMKLLVKYLDDIRSMAQKNTRIIFLGDKSAFDDDIQARLVEIEEISKNNDGLYVLVALNYGGKDEILTAAKRLARDYKEGKVDLDGFTEDDFDNYLYTKGIPPVDLIIRPSGEQRTSNFLIWQGAYAELLFMDVLWPDFQRRILLRLVTSTQGETEDSADCNAFLKGKELQDGNQNSDRTGSDTDRYFNSSTEQRDTLLCCYDGFFCHSGI